MSDQIGGPIRHPKHYNMGGPIGEDGSAEFEVIKLIEDLGWGFEFCMGNALKYVLRAPHKGAEAEDLAKAQWYLMRAVHGKGSIRPFAYRVFRSFTVICVAWGLHTSSRRASLANAVHAIMTGDPITALQALKEAREGGDPSKEMVRW